MKEYTKDDLETLRMQLKDLQQQIKIEEDSETMLDLKNREIDLKKEIQDIKVSIQNQQESLHKRLTYLEAEIGSRTNTKAALQILNDDISMIEADIRNYQNKLKDLKRDKKELEKLLK